MIYQGHASKAEVDSMLNHSWRLPDQEIAFSGCAYLPSLDSVSSFCGPFLDAQSCTINDLDDGEKVKGDAVTGRLLNQALDYFQKGLYNFFAQYILASRGYITWARVTNYYSSFFSVHALLCLQGQTITRITLAGKEKKCHIIPLNLTTHEFVISTRGIGRRAEHKVPWCRYYDIYDRYSHPIYQFEVVHKKAYVTDPSDESDQRNQINYVPFRGFGEMINQIEMENFKANYVSSLSTPPVGKPLDDYLTTLQALATDPNFQYFARSALRLLFVADILKRLASPAILNTENSFKLKAIERSQPPIEFLHGFKNKRAE